MTEPAQERQPPPIAVSGALPPLPPPARRRTAAPRPKGAQDPSDRSGGGHLKSGRALFMLACVSACFLALAGQLVRLALDAQDEVSFARAAPLGQTFARPDIIDRQGRLLATDLAFHSLFADPAKIIDVDVVVEKLAGVLDGLDQRALRESLADRSRRFAWIRRGLSPALAQQVHDLGLPGLGFRRELRRAYPMGRLAGHVIGTVNVDNKGQSGLERHIDEALGVEPILGLSGPERPPVTMTLDVGVQHALADELAQAMQHYRAAGAAGVVMDASTGAVLAAASLPDVAPSHPVELLEEARLNRLAMGAYELGSIFKPLTIAMVLDSGQVRLDTRLDVRQPLAAGSHTITDPHPAGRPLSVAEIFLRSSNVGTGMLAQRAGVEAHRAFLDRMGLLATLDTQIGRLAAPIVPEPWGAGETTTISYGHGLAVAPLQFAAAAAALVNGGWRVEPRFILEDTPSGKARQRLVKPQTSARIRDLFRLNVSHPSGTGKRADVPGYDVGGKTGTAEMPRAGGYDENAVISSFIAAFPMREPRFVTLVLLFEPKPTPASGNKISAGLNAAPTTAAIVRRIAPLLGLLPQASE